ncbi:hypothetical protein AC231_08125 [Clostridium pasteurianum]|nr:hypothetical protein AQ983_15190 [Clostridium pasteurianum DSM 525 = ATCC 6013]AOZ80176.1 hypothetical protein AQ984_15185 [Clostridium pasteurianum]ELP59129.1 hypothetical protein F502_11606 [Clostridium pasteurianum DSM 525 = ATCC 6013]OMH20646.1 hypothetical protein AC231_08125 [Clostridium pasteurianum]
MVYPAVIVLYGTSIQKINFQYRLIFKRLNDYWWRFEKTINHPLKISLQNRNIKSRFKRRG